MNRHGKPLTVLADGHPRRLSDGRNAWRKMNETQRATFLAFVLDESTEADRATMRDLLMEQDGGAK